MDETIKKELVEFLEKEERRLRIMISHRELLYRSEVKKRGATNQYIIDEPKMIQELRNRASQYRYFIDKLSNQ